MQSHALIIRFDSIIQFTVRINCVQLLTTSKSVLTRSIPTQRNEIVILLN